MQRGQSDSKIVPEPVMDSVNRTLVGLDELRNNFLHFLTLCEPEVLEEMPPIDRAQSLLLLARATSTIVTCKPSRFLIRGSFIYIIYCAVQ